MDPDSQQVLTIISCILCVQLIISFVASILVFVDCKKRNINYPFLWAIFALIIPLIGVIVYFAVGRKTGNPIIKKDDEKVSSTINEITQSETKEISIDKKKNDLTKEQKIIRNVFLIVLPLVVIGSIIAALINSANNKTGNPSDLESCPKVKIIYCYHKGVGIMVKNHPGYYQCMFSTEKSCTKSNGITLCGDKAEGRLPYHCLPAGFNDWMN